MYRQSYTLYDRRQDGERIRRLLGKPIENTLQKLHVRLQIRMILRIHAQPAIANLNLRHRHQKAPHRRVLPKLGLFERMEEKQLVLDEWSAHSVAELIAPAATA